MPSFDPLPSRPLVTESLAIRVRGLNPYAAVTLRLCNRTPDGVVFASEATFNADENGTVDLTQQAPISGDYNGIDAMGLFWSRRPTDGKAAAACAPLSANPLTVTLTAMSSGSELLVASIERSFVSENVLSRDVRSDGLVGKVFEPKEAGMHPAVLVVGGSGGGLYWSQDMAGLLASHGYVAFALAYFGMEGLPKTLNQIPLEYFGKALAWLSGQPRVIADRIGAVGYSRGGELVLLLGASYPQIRTVVAYAPSGVLWPAFPSTGYSAWTQGGEDIPFASTLTYEQWDEALAQGRAEPDSLEWYLIPLQDKQFAERATIAVERINGPIMMISGTDDKLWPSSDLAEIAVQRLESKRFGNAVHHLAYAGAGHSLGWPNAPTTVTRFRHAVSCEDLDLGGSPKETAHACQDSWLRMLEFLKGSLSISTRANS